MQLDLAHLLALQQKPAPFTPGERQFWDDPHISAQMLTAHLNPNSDLASRRPATIERSVEWLASALSLQPGDAVLDLGCGPGLYAARFAQRGLAVTGVDLSARSIDHAVGYAQENGLEIEYRCMNYLELDEASRFDAALLIYGDFCPLSPAQRRRLLGNVQRALKPGGYFAFDVTTRTHRKKFGLSNGWYTAETGFWKPTPHLVLEEGFDYPEQSIFLDQYTVIESSGKMSVYRNWYQDYNRETITAELEDGGFTVLSLWSDLKGAPLDEDSDWIGVVAQKARQ